MVAFVVVERFDMFTRRSDELEDLTTLNAHARLLSLDYVPQDVVVLSEAAT